MANKDHKTVAKGTLDQAATVAKASESTGYVTWFGAMPACAEVALGWWDAIEFVSQLHCSQATITAHEHWQPAMAFIIMSEMRRKAAEPRRPLRWHAVMAALTVIALGISECIRVPCQTRHSKAQWSSGTRTWHLRSSRKFRARRYRPSWNILRGDSHNSECPCNNTTAMRHAVLVLQALMAELKVIKSGCSWRSSKSSSLNASACRQGQAAHGIA